LSQQSAAEASKVPILETANPCNGNVIARPDKVGSFLSIHFQIPILDPGWKTHALATSQLLARQSSNLAHTWVRRSSVCDFFEPQLNDAR
jgi:hypothetical protein